MEKLRILCLNEPEPINGVTWWRMYRPMLMLEQMYGDYIELIWNRGYILPFDMLRAHVAIAWRPSEPAQLNVIRMLADVGIKIICDFDDDLLNIPSGSIAFNTLGQRGQVVRGVLRLADMVWTSTDVLKKVYAHKNAHTIPNSLMPTDMVTTPNPVSKTVVWRGDFHQNEDISASQEWYFKILKKASRFVWFGYMPSWQHPENVEYRKWTTLHSYLNLLETEIKPNLMWKPMREDLLFNAGKSNIAKLEAIAAGAVPVTNFYNRPTWEHAFRDINFDEKTLFGAWEAGRDDILKNYNLSRWTDERYRLLWSLFETKKSAADNGATKQAVTV